MKLTKLATLMTAGVSCAYLTQCTTPNHLQSQPTIAPTVNNTFNYPKTRTHQEGYDNFLSGEYGRPDNLPNAGRGDSSAFLRPDDGVDHYFDEKVTDKYRWLEEVDVISPEYAKESSADRERNFVGTRNENDVPDGRFNNPTTQFLQTIPKQSSSEVNDWVNAQNTATTQYLQAIPYYDKIRKNINTLMDHHHYVRKVKKDKVGEIYLFRHEDGFHRITLTDVNGNEKEIFSEKALSQNNANTITISDGDMYVSKDGSYIALFLTDGNADSDKTALHVLDSKTGADVITPIKPLGREKSIVWIDDDSFFYLGDKAGWTEVRRHDVGQKRFNDPIEVAASHLDAGVSIKGVAFEGENDRYLIIDAWKRLDTFYVKDTKSNKVYRIHSKKQDDIVSKKDTFTVGTLAKFVHLDDKTGDIWFISGENTPKNEIIKSNLNNLKKREVVVPAPTEYDEILEAVYHEVDEGYFLVKYRKDGIHRVIITNAQGAFIKDITPLEAGNASDFYSHIIGKKDDDKVDDSAKKLAGETDENYVSFRMQNTITPRMVYKYSIKKGEFIDERRRDLIPFDQNVFETKHVMYTSKDGTQIPMVISHKKGLQLNGKNPTVLYGYGGFGLALDNAFRLDRAAWLEHDGVWVQAHLRGGAEYGEAWHEQAKFTNKMNVFDDFEAAADYLFAKGYTSPDYLAISGASNGGLLVGAAMTLNPSKYRVALPEVGVLDMLRHDSNYHTDYWKGEYGSAYDSMEMYNALKSYSPYHNVKAGVCYPSTIVMTSKRDDRVTPSHSYKFAAELQDKQGCERPTFLYAAETQGHGPYTRNDRKDNYQIVTAFRLHEMGIKDVPTVQRPSVQALKGEKWLQEEAKEAAKKQETIKKHSQ